VLYSTEEPWLHPGVELAKVWLLGLSPADENLVLGGNFLRLSVQTRKVPMAVAPSAAATRLRPAPIDPWLASR
jgi:hypothetical protein